MIFSNKPWSEEYARLNLCGGHIRYILDDCEDMAEIRYDDGMLIDIGKPETFDSYCIMVLASDDMAGWANPLAEIYVPDKRDLPARIQEVIFQYRQTDSKEV